MANLTMPSEFFPWLGRAASAVCTPGSDPPDVPTLFRSALCSQLPERTQGRTFGVCLASRATTMLCLCRRALVLSVLLFPVVGCGSGSGEAVPQPRDTTALTTEQLPLACATLVGAWHEVDEFFDDVQEWHGSAAFVGLERGVLVDKTIVLVTNSHCLSLGDLALGDMFTDDVPEIAAYRLLLRVGDKEAVVREIAETPVDVDVALVRIATDGLSLGRDFLIPPRVDISELKVGMRVAAVGSPIEPEVLAGTVTFGHVSNIRDHPSGCPIIQHDAPLNPGNSGGPLFVELAPDEWYLAGVNFAKASGAEGIGFAFALQRALEEKFIWAPASPAGAAKLIKEIYQTEAVLVAQ